MLTLQSRDFPEFSKNPRTYSSLLTRKKSSYVGVDLEWFVDTGEPYQVSIHGEGIDHPLSCSWRDGEKLVHRVNSRGLVFVGHNFKTADAPVLKKKGIKIPNERIEDTLIWHYLLNSHLAKGSSEKDSTTGEIEYRQGQGLFDLGHFMSLYVPEIPYYKKCRGWDCKGPCPKHNPEHYNALDGTGPLLGLWRIKEEAKRRGFSRKVYEHMLTLQDVCMAMTDLGTPLNLKTIRRLKDDFEAQQRQLFDYSAKWVGARGKLLKKPRITWLNKWNLNPKSATQVPKWCQEQFGYRPASSEVEELEKYYNRLNASQKSSEAGKLLSNLCEHKRNGKGFTSWFSDDVIEKVNDSLGYWHCRWNPCGSSLSRVVSTSPNQQNMPKHGPMKVLRQAIEAPPGFLIVSADSKQGELRVILYRSGVDPKEAGHDAFTWLVQNTGSFFTDLSSTTKDPYLQEPRNAAKRFTHAYNYMEGCKLIDTSQLDRHKREILAGALKVYKDWVFHDKFKPNKEYYVAFTGVNLARTFYGKSDFASRKKALEAQSHFEKVFPSIRAFQRKVTQEIEENDFLRHPNGRQFIPLNHPVNTIKEGTAFQGQSGLATYIQEGMIKMHNAGHTPIMNIHDDNVFLIPVGTSKRYIKDFMGLMAEESNFMDGFACPIDIEVGKNLFLRKDFERWTGEVDKDENPKMAGD